MNRIALWIRDNLASNILVIMMVISLLNVIYFAVVRTRTIGKVTSLSVVVTKNKKYTVTSSLHAPMMDYDKTIISDTDSVTADKTVKELAGVSLSRFKEVSTVGYMVSIKQ